MDGLSNSLTRTLTGSKSRQAVMSPETIAKEIEAAASRASTAEHWETLASSLRTLERRIQFLSLVPEEVFKEAREKVLCDSGQIIKAFDDWRTYTETDGRLNGRVTLSDERTLPLVGGKLIEKINDLEITNCLNIQIHGGSFTGAIRSTAGQFIPVVAGEPIHTYDRRKILHAEDIHIVDGKLNGKLRLDGLSALPVFEGEVLTRIDGYLINDCRDVQNIGGKLNCVARFSNESWLPVVGGKIWCRLADEPLKCCWTMRVINGEVHALVSLGDRKLPVVKGSLLSAICGEEILMTHIKNFASDLTAWVNTDTGPRAIVDGELWRHAEEHYKGYSELESFGGRLSGAVNVSGRSWLPIIDDEVISSVQGHEIETAYEVKNIAGRLCCGARLRDGTNVRVLFGEIVEHSI